MKIRVSVIGATGYTGVELVRLLQLHPYTEISCLVSETYKDNDVGTVFPHLAKVITKDFSNLDVDEIAKNSDVIFLALPHTKAAIMAADLLKYPHCKVIDLSADLRLNDATVYAKWYEHQHPAPELLKEAVYGLSEVGLTDKIAKSRLIANPGCYPTASILAVAPILKNKPELLALEQIPLILDAKSGVSGAGRSLNLGAHFCEVMNNFSAYQIAGIHRHIPEIEQELAKLTGHDIVIQFTPHLIPTPRGLMVTAYCKLKKDIALAEILELYQNYYKDRYFIRVGTNSKPGIKSVIGSNFCDINLHLDKRTNMLVVVSTIDNLLKGASGQAVQNMNLIYGLAEETGLETSSIYP